MMIESELAASETFDSQWPPKSAPRVVIVYKTFGPYHVARLRHVTEQARLQGIWVEGLALAGKQANYSWLKTKDGGLGFPSTTLFPEETLENVSKVKMIKGLKDYIDRVKPTIIFTSLYASFPMAYLAIATRLQGGKAAIMSDSTWFDQPRHWFKEKIKRIALFPYSGAFVSGSRAQEYIMSLGMPEQRIVCGVDVVDNQAISNHIASLPNKNKQSIICVARLIPEKNLFRLIDAYAVYRREYANKKPLSLVICGSGPLEAQLRRYAQRIGESGVIFTGFVQPPELFAWLCRARTLMLPSVSETWGLVVNEAMASGLPVLVSEKCGCVPDLVRPGKTGWSFKPEDIESMARLMSRVQRLSAEEYQLMADASRQLISGWDLSRFSDGILTLIERLSL